MESDRRLGRMVREEPAARSGGPPARHEWVAVPGLDHVHAGELFCSLRPERAMKVNPLSVGPILGYTRPDGARIFGRAQIDRNWMKTGWTTPAPQRHRAPVLPRRSDPEGRVEDVAVCRDPVRPAARPLRLHRGGGGPGPGAGDGVPLPGRLDRARGSRGRPARPRGRLRARLGRRSRVPAHHRHPGRGLGPLLRLRIVPLPAAPVRGVGLRGPGGQDLPEHPPPAHRRLPHPRRPDARGPDLRRRPEHHRHGHAGRRVPAPLPGGPPSARSTCGRRWPRCPPT